MHISIITRLVQTHQHSEVTDRHEIQLVEEVIDNQKYVFEPEVNYAEDFTVLQDFLLVVKVGE